MNELGHSLERMSFVQLLLLFGFVTTYMVSVGGLFGGWVRLRAAAAALAQAVAFVALTDPWVHGALLVAFVVGALGVFVMLSWLLARLFGPRSMPLPLSVHCRVSWARGSTARHSAAIPVRQVGRMSPYSTGRRRRRYRRSCSRNGRALRSNSSSSSCSGLLDRHT